MTEEYLTKHQYKDSTKLAKRANLFVKYGQGDWFGWLAEKAEFADDMAVLDIGCGAGWFWANAAEAIPADLDICLADLSDGMVAEAGDRLRGVGRWPVVDSVTADVCNLPFPDASFDRVLAFHMLYHAPDQPKAIAEIARVLKPDGMALVSTNGEKNTHTADRLRQLEFNLPDVPVINFTLENAMPLLAAAFGSVEMHSNSYVMKVTDPEDVLAYLTSFPPGDSASPEQIQSLLARIVTEFQRGDGVFDIPIENGAFVCRKPA